MAGRDNAENEKTKAGVAAAAIGAVALAAWGAYALFTGSKTMTALGREHRIFRDDFEQDPASYFRDLRRKGKK